MIFATLLFLYDKPHLLVQVVDGADVLGIIEKVCGDGILRAFCLSL